MKLDGWPNVAPGAPPRQSFDALTPFWRGGSGFDADWLRTLVRGRIEIASLRSQ
jgi:hypothetical protein